MVQAFLLIQPLMRKDFFRTRLTLFNSLYTVMFTALKVRVVQYLMVMIRCSSCGSPSDELSAKHTVMLPRQETPFLMYQVLSENICPWMHFEEKLLMKLVH